MLVRKFLPDLLTRFPPIQIDIYQTLDSPDDEHGVALNM
jgi:hypothetical protein